MTTERTNASNLTAREIRHKKIMLKRQRQLRIRIAAAIAAFIIILSSVVGLTSFMSKAEESTDEFKTKYYTSVMVPYGSSLSVLSEQYIDDDYYDSLEDYMKEVEFINHLQDDEIKAGSYLIMPYYS